MNKKEEFFNKFQKEICADCWGACFHYKPQEIKNKYNTICYIEDTTKAVGVGVFLRTIGYNISNMHHPMAFYRMVELNHEIITTDFNVAFNSGFSLGKEITLQNRLDNISQWVKDRNEDRANNKEFCYSNDFVDCGDNADLMMAVARMTDEHDLNQFFIMKRPNIEEEEWYINTQWKHFETDCNVDWAKTACRKATLEEIIEKFKK